MGEWSEKIVKIGEEIARRTSCEHYRLVLNEERVPGVADSKIGGKPYWPDDKNYPVDSKGNKMLMVMQINCAQAGLKAPLPEQGMLQWFISRDEELMYGCQGNYDDQGTGFRIIYHEAIDENAASPADVPTHDQVGERRSPVKREVAIDAVAEETVMGVSDGRFNRLFQEITEVEPSEKRWYEELVNNDCLYLERNLGMKRPCHQMLGYPVYTQDDARRDIETHDTLLFQLDSQFSTVDRKELVMWGDMGSGFIFINRDDLGARDFSRTYYCWDCG